jgi:hypothetical protein
MQLLSPVATNGGTTSSTKVAEHPTEADLMDVTHYARRSLAAAALALALAGCGKDSNAPSEFNPQGTSADMAAAQGAFASAPTASFAAVGAEISTALGGSPLVASSAALTVTRPSQASARYVKALASLVPTRRGIQASATAVPATYLGATFVWDGTTNAYVQSDLTGAPSNGVRFLLYAVDPVTLQVVEPAVEVGYVDILDQSTSASTGFRVKVVEGSVVYLDYTVAANAASTGGLVTVSGFASNGSTLANFTLKNTISENAGGLVLALDYDLNVPSRGVSLNWTATFANISDTETVVTLDLGISGPNGQVRLVGTYGATGGSFSVKVNGDLFATVTLNDSGQTVTGAGGAALTAEEEATLHDIMNYYEVSLVAFSELMLPLGG